MTTRISVALLILMLILLKGISQKSTSGAFKKLAESIAANNKYESRYVGFASTPSTQYQHYQQLRATASKAELASLLHNKNAVVRIYSFEALYERDPNLAEKLSPKLLKDTTTFMTLQGCIAGRETVRNHVSRMLRNID